MLLLLLGVLAASIPLTLADVQFTSPAAGASVPAGKSITISWKDSGSDPAIPELTSYSLTLCAGGNEQGTFIPLTTFSATGSFTGGNSITVTVTPAIGDDVQNAYFLQMLSIVRTGGTVTNYSPRFSIAGMTGAFTADVEAGLKTVSRDTTTSPATVNTALQGGDVPVGAMPDDEMFQIPFQEQTGPIKYAPMQQVPPTSITATNTSPRYPTSSVEIAKTYLPTASQVTTKTQLQTFKTNSRINTASPAPDPKDDMAKFLNRWKD